MKNSESLLGAAVYLLMFECALILLSMVSGRGMPPVEGLVVGGITGAITFYFVHRWLLKRKYTKQSSENRSSKLRQKPPKSPDGPEPPTDNGGGDSGGKKGS